MTDLHESINDSGEFEFIGLDEVEENGVGVAYEVSGIQIEPVGIYIGDGLFVGICVEDRPGVLSLRIGYEVHHDRKPGKTLLPIRVLELREPPAWKDHDALIPVLVDEICLYYVRALEDYDQYRGGLTKEDLEFKLRRFSNIQTRIFNVEDLISPGDRIKLLP